jgi:hypothetical protein
VVLLNYFNKRKLIEKTEMKKALFTLLAATVVSTVSVHAIPPDQLVSIGSTAKVTGTGSPSAFLCDFKATEDKWMEYINDGDTGAQRELLSQGRLFPVAVRIFQLSPSRISTHEYVPPTLFEPLL